MKTHEVKCWPKFFNAVVKGDKTAEIRKADRKYMVGDRIVLQEWVQQGKQSKLGEHTGNEATCQIEHIVRSHEIPGIQPGFVMLSLRLLGVVLET